jgi:hypothetical protein
MPKKLPIKIAKDISKEYNQDQVIIITWDKTSGTTHVVTYGKTKEDCVQASQGGNKIKNTLLGWSAKQSLAIPSRSSWKWLFTDEQVSYNDIKEGSIYWLETVRGEGFVQAIIPEDNQGIILGSYLLKDCPLPYVYDPKFHVFPEESDYNLYKCVTNDLEVESWKGNKK